MEVASQPLSKLRGLLFGVEKVSPGNAATRSLIKTAAQRVGSQSIVAVLDVKVGLRGRYEVFTHNGTKKINRNPADMARQLEELGCGEIFLNSIDRDGTMKGYDFSFD